MSKEDRLVDLEKWQGRKRPYDLVKEFAIALLAVVILVVACSTIFGSPDERAVTLQQWAKTSPSDFVKTATSELAGGTTSATYGAPYNQSGEGQKLGPLKLQKWLGVKVPIDSARDFVVAPLTMSDHANIQSALVEWKSANGTTQTKWATDYASALDKAGDVTTIADPSGAFGPVPVMTSGLLEIAQVGALDGLLTTQASPMPTDFTKPLLFLADGTYLEDLAVKQHLGGDQWGMMNETGSYPGQSWLWLYSFWYQIEPFKSSDNADAQVWAIMGLLTVGLLFLPKIPILNQIPRRIPIQRLIWRQYYKEENL